MKQVELPIKFVDELVDLPETGMGYQIINVLLNSGENYDVAVANCTYIVSVKSYDGVPFDPEEIHSIKLTHERF